MSEYSRRNFVVTALSSGFAAATLPVAAHAQRTGDEGLLVGEVKIPVRDGQIPAYRAVPRGVRRPPVMLVVQEIFGVHEHIKDICRRLAKLGCLAVAPELYARQGDVARLKDVADILTKVVAKVPDRQVMSDLDATAAWATKEGKGNPESVGIIGFCWGGRMAWLYAAHNPALTAAVAFYGRLGGEKSELTPRHPIDLVGELKAPVLGIYGGSDSGIPVTSVQEMQAALKKSPKAPARTSIIRLYPGAGHGFFADYRASYRKEDAKEAWDETRAWLKRFEITPP